MGWVATACTGRVGRVAVIKVMAERYELMDEYMHCLEVLEAAWVNRGR